MFNLTHIPFDRASYLPVLEQWAEAYWALDGADVSFAADAVPTEGLVTLDGAFAAVISLMVDVPQTRGSMHFMLIANPSLGVTESHQVIDPHIQAVVAHSTDKGNLYQIWLCDHPGLTTRLTKRHAFDLQSSNQCAFLIRRAPEAPRVAYLEAPIQGETHA